MSDSPPPTGSPRQHLSQHFTVGVGYAFETFLRLRRPKFIYIIEAASASCQAMNVMRDDHPGLAVKNPSLEGLGVDSVQHTSNRL